MIELGFSITDSIILIDRYDVVLDNFLEKLTNSKRKKELVNLLEQSNLLSVVQNVGTKKGNPIFYKYRQQLVNELDELYKKKKETVFERLKKLKTKGTNTVFDRLKYMKGVK